jgi:hypothetical protein
VSYQGIATLCRCRTDEVEDAMPARATSGLCRAGGSGDSKVGPEETLLARQHLRLMIDKEDLLRPANRDFSVSPLLRNSRPGSGSARRAPPVHAGNFQDGNPVKIRRLVPMDE